MMATVGTLSSLRNQILLLLAIQCTMPYVVKQNIYTYGHSDKTFFDIKSQEDPVLMQCILSSCMLDVCTAETYSKLQSICD